MAVYTRVTDHQVQEFLEHYDIGSLKNLQGIEQGVENTNYILTTTTGKYILTLFEKRTDPADLPFFFAFTEHLSRHGIPCPEIIEDRDRAMLRTLAGKPAAVVSFLPGRDIPFAQISDVHCLSLGRTLGRMHQAATTFDLTRDNTLSLSGWKDLAAHIGARADDVAPGLTRFIKDELLYLEGHWPIAGALPRAAIHADIFPDNVFFAGDDVCGVIDFYFSCTDFLAYDLALVINAWCFDTQCGMTKSCRDAVMEGYAQTRIMLAAEKENLSLLCRGASMRIVLTRLNDWVFHPAGALVQPKDPMEYVTKLKWHQTHDICEG